MICTVSAINLISIVNAIRVTQVDKNIPALRAKGLHKELLEHKGELLPSWYREAVEQELNSENQKRWGCVF